MNQTFVLYHQPCYDGFGAAYAAWKALGYKAKYVPVSYGSPPPEIPRGSHVYIIDFSYSREILLDMKSRFATLFVLDHHKTAQEALKGLDFTIFDMNRSGAMMAWNHWHPNVTPPQLIRHLEDRDLWRFKLPGTEEICAAIWSYPLDFEVWDKFDINTLILEGKSIARFRTQIVEMICKQAYLREVPEGYEIPVVNATAFWSEVGHKLIEMYPDHPFVASWYRQKDGKQLWQLRSKIGGFDVGDYAKKFGGGGHPSAAGFPFDGEF